MGKACRYLCEYLTSRQQRLASGPGLKGESKSQQHDAKIFPKEFIVVLLSQPLNLSVLAGKLFHSYFYP